MPARLTFEHCPPDEYPVGWNDPLETYMSQVGTPEGWAIPPPGEAQAWAITGNRHDVQRELSFPLSDLPPGEMNVHIRWYHETGSREYAVFPICLTAHAGMIPDVRPSAPPPWLRQAGRHMEEVAGDGVMWTPPEQEAQESRPKTVWDHISDVPDTEGEGKSTRTGTTPGPTHNSLSILEDMIGTLGSDSTISLLVRTRHGNYEAEGPNMTEVIRRLHPHMHRHVRGQLELLRGQQERDTAEFNRLGERIKDTADRIRALEEFITRYPWEDPPSPPLEDDDEIPF